MRPLARETGFVLETADATHLARRLRDLGPIDVDAVGPRMLRSAARGLRRAAYDLTTAAGNLEHRASVLEFERSAS